MRWADGRSDKAGGVLDGQTGGRGPAKGAAPRHFVVPAPSLMGRDGTFFFFSPCPPLLTCKQPHTHTHGEHAKLMVRAGNEEKKTNPKTGRQSLPSVV